MEQLEKRVRKLVHSIMIPKVDFTTSKTIATIAENTDALKTHRFTLEIVDKESERARLLNELHNLKNHIAHENHVYRCETMWKIARHVGVVTKLYDITSY